MSQITQGEGIDQILARTAVAPANADGSKKKSKSDRDADRAALHAGIRKFSKAKIQTASQAQAFLNGEETDFDSPSPPRNRRRDIDPSSMEPTIPSAEQNTSKGRAAIPGFGKIMQQQAMAMQPQGHPAFGQAPPTVKQASTVQNNGFLEGTQQTDAQGSGIHHVDPSHPDFAVPTGPQTGYDPFIGGVPVPQGTSGGYVHTEPSAPVHPSPQQTVAPLLPQQVVKEVVREVEVEVEVVKPSPVDLYLQKSRKISMATNDGTFLLPVVDIKRSENSLAILMPSNENSTTYIPKLGAEMWVTWREDNRDVKERAYFPGTYVEIAELGVVVLSMVIITDVKPGGKD